jgi:hypothetical protein
MEIVSNPGIQNIAGAASAGQQVTVVETPVIGKHKTSRVTTTSKSIQDGQTVSVLIEEFHDGKLLSKHFEQFRPNKICTREIFEADGSLISSETERSDDSGRMTRVVVRGSGKSSTTRIMCGEIEARATERSILIETPRASYSYHPFEGKWSSYYKDIGLKLELKSNYLKNPNATLDGPDGIKLVFRSGRLIDMHLSKDLSADSSKNTIPSIIE